MDRFKINQVIEITQDYIDAYHATRGNHQSTGVAAGERYRIADISPISEHIKIDEPENGQIWLSLKDINKDTLIIVA